MFSCKNILQRLKKFASSKSENTDATDSLDEKSDIVRRLIGGRRLGTWLGYGTIPAFVWKVAAQPSFYVCS